MTKSLALCLYSQSARSAPENRISVCCRYWLAKENVHSMPSWRNNQQMNERTQEEIRIRATGDFFLKRTAISKEKRLILTAKCAIMGSYLVHKMGKLVTFSKKFH